MVERKSALKRALARPRLDELVEQARDHTITNAELREQRISFVYGNAPKGSRITRESIEKSVDRARLLDA